MAVQVNIYQTNEFHQREARLRSYHRERGGAAAGGSKRVHSLAAVSSNLGDI